MATRRAARAERTDACPDASSGLTRVAMESASASVTVRIESGALWPVASAGRIRTAHSKMRGRSENGAGMVWRAGKPCGLSGGREARTSVGHPQRQDTITGLVLLQCRSAYVTRKCQIGGGALCTQALSYAIHEVSS